MSIQVKEGQPPFVIDCSLPRGIFQRAPGALELVATEEDQAMTFASAEEAEAFLRSELDEQGLAAYDWTILPHEQTLGGRV